MEHTTQKAEAVKSESSVTPVPFNKPKADQLKLPTWGVLVALFAAFFILKSFIYIPDEKRKGK